MPDENTDLLRDIRSLLQDQSKNTVDGFNNVTKSVNRVEKRVESLEGQFSDMKFDVGKLTGQFGAVWKVGLLFAGVVLTVLLTSPEIATVSLSENETEQLRFIESVQRINQELNRPFEALLVTINPDAFPETDGWHPAVAVLNNQDLTGYVYFVIGEDPSGGTRAPFHSYVLEVESKSLTELIKVTNSVLAAAQLPNFVQGDFSYVIYQNSRLPLAPLEQAFRNGTLKENVRMESFDLPSSFSLANLQRGFGPLRRTIEEFVP